jgi:2-polyprenyl-3-methyl-5-hydroxy-6-metoxy-1,4-benzoquinol methylase
MSVPLNTAAEIPLNVTGTIQCPVCASPFTAYVRQVMTRRTKRSINLYSCLDCRSFWNPVEYHQHAVLAANSIRWHESVAERNRVAAERLFDELFKLGHAPQNVIEIGCGSGSILAVAKQRGANVIGYDVDPISTAHGAAKYGIDLRNVHWSADSGEPFDMLLCISVLEHLQQPRSLIKAIADGCKKNSAVAVVSVPTLDRGRWSYLTCPDPTIKGTPFFDNDVHVTHFSSEGMTRALRHFGAASVTRVNSGLWNVFLAEF